MAQSLSHILLHIVFSTKNRHPFIQPSIETELYNYLSKAFHSHGSHVYEIGGIEDHIHILTTLPRTISLSTLLEETKKGSSKWIKTKGSEFQKFAWQKGYGVFSVSESNIDQVKKYIQNQKSHHKKFSFKEEFVKLLKLHNVKYDEKYLWTD